MQLRHEVRQRPAVTERAEKLEQRRVRRLARRQARHEAEEAAVRAEAQADVDQRSRLRHGHQVDATILKMNAREAADEKLKLGEVHVVVRIEVELHPYLVEVCDVRRGDLEPIRARRS